MGGLEKAIARLAWFPLGRFPLGLGFPFPFPLRGLSWAAAALGSVSPFPLGGSALGRRAERLAHLLISPSPGVSRCQYFPPVALAARFPWGVGLAARLSPSILGSLRGLGLYRHLEKSHLRGKAEISSSLPLPRNRQGLATRFAHWRV